MVARVTPATLALLARVADDVFDAPIDWERAARWLASPDVLLFVALADGVVIGQVAGVVHRHPDADAELFIDNLGVTPDWQRRRIGTRLVEAVVAAAQGLGCAGVWVLTEPDNVAACGLYAALGLAAMPTMLFSADIEAAPGEGRTGNALRS